MYFFNEQRAALNEASKVLYWLPNKTCFGIEVTDEDSADEPSVLNIYATSTQHRNKLVTLLINKTEMKPYERDEHCESFKLGPLVVSVMDPEEWRIE